MELHCGTVLGKTFDPVSRATLLSKQSHCSLGHKTDPVGRATSKCTKPHNPRNGRSLLSFPDITKCAVLVKTLTLE